MSVIIAGIHTGIGKTVCSAIICEATGYDYLKPVQAGDLENTDSLFVQRHVANKNCHVHPEIYKLKIAASPHYAAQVEGLEITRERIILPSLSKNIVVETAGGIMSPLAKNFLNLDLIQHLALPVVLVSNNYLGSINHTLMSYSMLRSIDAKIIGIVFNGEKNAASEQFILEHTGLPFLFSIPTFKSLDKDAIADFAKTITINF